MTPPKIMIVRHAEKPIPGRTRGMRARGEIDDASLTALGWQRAGALVGFFMHPTAPHIARPDHVFAVRFDADDVNASRRPRQTMGPLAKSLGIEIDDRFGEQQELMLIKAVRQLTGTVLIAWSHENIPKIVSSIGAAVPTPAAWPEKRFDLVWVFDPRVSKTGFVQVPQRLLAGDSDTVAPVP